MSAPFAAAPLQIITADQRMRETRGIKGDRSGKPDLRGAYGLLGQEMIGWLTHLQHTPRKAAATASACATVAQKKMERRSALALMHYEAASLDAAVESGADELVDEGEAVCVAGCYRCLLSYYNQPDHELIDRRHRVALDFLLQLAGSGVVPGAATSNPGGGPEGHAVASDLPPDTPPPDAEFDLVDGVEMRFVWRRQRVCAVEHANAPPDLEDRMADLGFVMVILPSEVAARRAAMARISELLREKAA